MKARLILHLAAALSALPLVIACGRGGEGTPATRPFPEPSVPEIVAEDRDEAMAYAAEHYWDDFCDTSRAYLCDSAHVGGVKVHDVELRFSDFVKLLMALGPEEARAGLVRMYEVSSRCELADTASNVFETLLNFTDKYLYDPNSPARDEDLYGIYAGKLAGFEGFSPEKRSLYAHQARLCALNARGTPAADFRFRTAKGRTYSLYGIKADYILLFFSNPGCPACKEIIETLSGELDTDRMIASGKLAVLNIYIDEDLKAWYDYMPIYPKNWYNGYDPDGVIRSDLLYNVRAIPSLYLLGPDKTVLLKDAPNETVFYVLSQIAGE